MQFCLNLKIRFDGHFRELLTQLLHLRYFIIGLVIFVSKLRNYANEKTGCLKKLFSSVICKKLLSVCMYTNY